MPYRGIVTSLMDSSQWGGWLGQQDIAWTDTGEHDSKGHAINYLVVLGSGRGYTAAILDVDSGDLTPVPGTHLDQFTSVCDAAATCMIFGDALAAVGEYRAHMTAVADRREALAMLEAERSSPRNELEAWKARVKEQKWRVA